MEGLFYLHIYCVTFLSHFYVNSVEKDKACVRQRSAPQFNLSHRLTTKLDLSMSSNFSGCVHSHFVSFCSENSMCQK